MEPNYDVDYFINKFQAIPEELWNDDGDYRKITHPQCRCAMGHLGVIHSARLNDEARALADMLGGFAVVTDINDGYPKYLKYGLTPKQRILNALKEIKGTTNAD